MSVSMDTLLSNYTSSYGNRLYNSVDRNNDGTYSKQEVSGFASDYAKSTGIELDVDELFKAYDVDVSGALSTEEFAKVAEDDAFGINSLYSSQIEAETQPWQELQNTSSSQLSDWLSSMDNSQKGSLLQSTFKAETTGNLINAMFGSGGIMSSFTNAIAQYSNTMMLNTTQYMMGLSSSINLLL